MPRVARTVEDTPPGYKRCKHCAKSANAFIDVRSKHNECDRCRVGREREKQRRRSKGTQSVALCDVMHDAEDAIASTSTAPGADPVPGSDRKTAIHLTTADTATIYNSQRDALAELCRTIKTHESFRFHARFAASNPPLLQSTDENSNYTVVIGYIHNLNGELHDTVGWRFTSRGREKRAQNADLIAVHYNCCQDSGRSKPPKTPKDPLRGTKRKPMDRWRCNGRLTIAYEPQTQVVELRMAHDVNHPPYNGSRGRNMRFPVPIDDTGAPASLGDVPIMDAQIASQMFPRAAPLSQTYAQVVPVDPVLRGMTGPRSPAYMHMPNQHRHHSHPLDVPVFPDHIDSDPDDFTHSHTDSYGNIHV